MVSMRISTQRMRVSGGALAAKEQGTRRYGPSVEIFSIYPPKGRPLPNKSRSRLLSLFLQHTSVVNRPIPRAYQTRRPLFPVLAVVRRPNVEQIEVFHQQLQCLYLA